MNDEQDQILDKGTYEIVFRSKSIAQNKQVVGSTWVFKRKCLPNGTIQILKASIKVHKSLYGDCSAHIMWYNHLHKWLEDLGFQASKYKPCLFIWEGWIIVSYNDDAIVLAKNRSQVDYVLDGWRKQHFDFEKMGKLTNYLGIKIENHGANGALKLSQPHLT